MVLWPLVLEADVTKSPMFASIPIFTRHKGIPWVVIIPALWHRIGQLRSEKAAAYLYVYYAASFLCGLRFIPRNILATRRLIYGFKQITVGSAPEP